MATAGDVMLIHPLGDSAAFAWLQEADLACANLEVPLSHRGYPADKPIVHRADPALAGELATLGLDVVSFANNHSLDCGPEGLLDTLAALSEAGVAVVGAGERLTAAMQSRTLRAGPARVAFLGLSSTLPVGSAATDDRPGIAPLRVRVGLVADAPISEEQPGTAPYVATEVLADDLERAREAIRTARRDADAVVAMVHWGVPPGWAAPFQGLLAEYQRPLGHALVDAGADLVLGHHPHTLHGVEEYAGGLICYSLGNFIFHSLAPGSSMQLSRPSPPYDLRYVRPPELMESAVFLFTCEDRRWSLEIRPCAFDEQGECRPVSGARASAILERVAAHSAELGTNVRIEDGRGSVTVGG
jgi:poly-gamma-glutamate synthesis protein (capsule biosynthesis protein)